MSSYDSDDEEFRSAWESSFSAEKQCHVAERRVGKVQTRIDDVKERLTVHRNEAEESLRMSALHSKGLASVQKNLGNVASELQVCD